MVFKSSVKTFEVSHLNLMGVIAAKFRYMHAIFDRETGFTFQKLVLGILAATSL